MATLVLWRALLLPATAAPPRTAPENTPVYAALRPLVGGPAFLPIHVQIAHENTLYDFLPANPTAAATTASLLSGQSVEGNIRCRPVRSLGRDSRWRRIGYTARTSNDLLAFAEQQERSLSLTSNNWCAHARSRRIVQVKGTLTNARVLSHARSWTFATKLAQYAIDASDG